MANQTNPMWTAHNQVNNEGGEGYNPHPQFVGQSGGEPLWSQLSDKHYRLQNRLNGMSDRDAEYPALRADLDVLAVAAADALARKI